jgi:DNA-binding transcriptional LysR family regulator
MHIETLKIFCDVVENQSFSLAASQNFITQSAVSQQIRGLEERYGKRLLERRRGSVKPTPAGEILHRSSRAILQAYSEMEAQLQGLSNVVTGSVRVGTVHSVGLYELSEPLKAYFSDFPQVNVYLEYDRASSVYDQVLRGNVDFGIVAYPTARAQITVVEFRSDRLVIACAPDHPLTERGRVPVGALDGEKFIAFEPDLPTRKIIDRHFREHSVQIEHAMEFDNIETVKRAVEIDHGIAIVPLATVLQEQRQGTLAVLAFKGKDFTRPLAILHRKGRVLTPAMKKFIEILGLDLPE